MRVNKRWNDGKMPNKAYSKAQFRLFKGIAEGSIPAKGKLDATVAKELLGNQSSVGLPERHRAVSRRKRTWRFK